MKEREREQLNFVYCFFYFYFLARKPMTIAATAALVASSTRASLNPVYADESVRT
jgi:hypothetical protein